MNATELPPLIRDCVDGEVSPVTAAEARARAAMKKQGAVRTLRGRWRSQHDVAATGPVGRRRRARLLAGGLALTAAGMATAVAVASAGPAASGGPAPTGRAAARQYLLGAAASAAATPDRPGSYWYVRTTMVSVLGKITVQTWTQPGGRTWASVPALYRSLAPAKGERQFPLAGFDWRFKLAPVAISAVLPGWRTRYSTGAVTFGFVNASNAHGAGLVTYRQLQELPASPAGLVDWLLRYQRDFAKQTGLAEPEPATLIESLAELVAAEPAPPRVRAAAFRALAVQPNVTSLGPDHGGQALGISLGGKQHATLVIDPASQAHESLTVSTGQRLIRTVSIAARWVNRRP